MKNKFVTIPLVPTIILIIIIATIISCTNGEKKESKNLNENYIEEGLTEEGITFEVSDITAKAGDEITINIKMLEDSNFVAANFELIYDATKMKYVKYEKGEILKSGAMAIVNNDEDSNKVLIGYVGNPQSEINKVKKGDLISITFKINDSIGNTELNPEFKCTTLKEKDGTNIMNNINQGEIIVK